MPYSCMAGSGIAVAISSVHTVPSRFEQRRLVAGNGIFAAISLRKEFV